MSRLEVSYLRYAIILANYIKLVNNLSYFHYDSEMDVCPLCSVSISWNYICGIAVSRNTVNCRLRIWFEKRSNYWSALNVLGGSMKPMVGQPSSYYNSTFLVVCRRIEWHHIVT